jgi:trimethylamine--corrinoid protein Co-methyltransferase
MPLTPDSSFLSYISLLDDGEIERIYHGAVKVLAHSGFRIQHRAILERLEKQGARVDYAGEVFWPTPDMIRRLEEQVRYCSPNPTRARLLRQPPYTGSSITYNGTLFYDWSEGVQRAATLHDVENMLKACHMLKEVKEFGPTVTAQDVPPPIEPVVSFALGIKTTDQPVLRVELVLPEQLPYLEELDTITQGREVRYNYDGCAINNFTVDSRAMGCLYATWQRNGLANWEVYSCPVAGATAPVTLAGAVVVGVAETLGAWFAGWALNNEVSLTAMPCAGVMDMRAGRVLFSCPEAVMINAGIFQVFDRMLGMQAGMLADYTDAKVPGLQAAHDKIFNGLTYAWLTGQVNYQRGTLEAGKCFSPTQMIIDCELNSELANLARGMEVNEETLALDLIAAAGPGSAINFLEQDHTLRNYRQALWYPSLMDRTNWESPEAERQKETLLLRRAESRWRDALARYEPPHIPREKIEAADDVVRRAREALL